MPELPEVETIRLQLNRALKGLKVQKAQVFSPKNFIGRPADLIGQKITRVDRRAKMILIRLASGNCLAIHLKLTGQLIYRVEEPPFAKSYGGVKQEGNGPFAVKELPNKFTRVMIEFNDGNRLFFNDLRKFGWIKIADPKRLNQELEKFGPEPFSKDFSIEYLKENFQKTSRPIKTVLMDQEKIAGIGNIYANEALFLAGILPSRPANSLMPEEITKLRKSVLAVLKEAIKHQGTSDRDEAYRQVNGQKGRHQNYLWVYGRAKLGQKCRKCQAVVKRIKIGGRGTFYCPKCQH